MSSAEFEFVAKLLKKECGLVISADKTYLVESRLAPIARRLGHPDVRALIRAMMSQPAPDRVRDVVEAMVTNETFFFRDKKPFDQFRDFVLPELLRLNAARRSIRIWCAASSTGQEPYSLAMLLQEASARLAGWRVEIVATDISTEVLQQAKLGIYSQFEVQRGLPIQLLVKHFEQAGEKWQVVQAVRSKVDFRRFNLLDLPKPLGVFDVVFCRNVLIYFDQETKTGILNRIASVMQPAGILVLGGAETVLGMATRFQPNAAQRGLYMLDQGDPVALRAAG